MLLPLVIVFMSNYYLQLSQNKWSWAKATNFAFNWHVEKFFLGCLVLFIFWLFLLGVTGSWGISLLFYSIALGLLGFANRQKMFYRMEPIYPDDLKMITELSLLKEMVGTGPFLVCLLLLGIALGGLIYAVYRSLSLPRNWQIARVGCLLGATALLFYINDFNNPQNLLRRKFNHTAKWVTYSQQMNYYNTGFMGGFLYNLKVDPMEKPANYSQAKIDEVVARYQATTVKQTEAPNIVYVMAESFSNPLNLVGVKAAINPLTRYQALAEETYSGKMLSQNYGGGTANIEFEALTGLSMEPFNSQLTTPYTMLVSKLTGLPSLVSVLNGEDYQTTAVHPYNTSMYKRKDVYNTLGFDNFIAENTMKHTERIENNQYISDASAYKEVLDVLQADAGPQFVHLVTMQAHLPFDDKYSDIDYGLETEERNKTLNNYMADVDYSSQALGEFIEAIKKLPRRTLVVFWGDHLPSFYSEALQKANSQVDLHLTEFLLYDTAQQIKANQPGTVITSPIYFAPLLFEQAGLGHTGFYQLLTELKQELPAFEKGYYYSQEGTWSETLSLSPAGEALYDDYQLIQYDLVAGQMYSLKTDFFKLLQD